MKNLAHGYLAKTVAYILAVLVFISTVFMAASIVMTVYASSVYGSEINLKNNITARYLQQNASQVYYAFVDDLYGYSEMPIDQYVDERNYYCTIYDDGVIKFNNKPEGADGIKATFSEEYLYNKNLETTVEKTILVELHSKKQLSQTDLYAIIIRLIDFSFANQTLYFIFTVINFFLLIAITVFLCMGAGRRVGEDGVVLTFVDRIPFDIYLLLAFGLVAFEVMFLNSIWGESDVFTIIMLAVYLVIDYIVALFMMTGFCARVKAKKLIKNTVIYKVLTFVFRLLKRLFYKTRIIIDNAPALAIIGVSLAAITVANVIIAYNVYYWEDLAVFFIGESLLLMPVVLYFFANLNRLHRALKKISDGDLKHRLKDDYMPYPLKGFVKTINNIGQGMSKAVDEKMRSERLKTELITNVSHDIKTPLTSIINYVDLIKKEGCDDETINEYIFVLERQSARLKKLIEDLVEASKASTGNIAVSYEKCELGVLLAQTVGEYQQRLKDNELELVLDCCEEPVNILADGRHLWRIFDNLMSNICKYSQSGTRVYLSLARYGNKAVLTFRNISKTQLNISGDELMERFVRGDSSRNTEGSGLGLSIAKSLVELQKGKMVLTVDGDLFKALITFETLKNDETV